MATNGLRHYYKFQALISSAIGCVYDQGIRGREEPTKDSQFVESNTIDTSCLGTVSYANNYQEILGEIDLN